MAFGFENFVIDENSADIYNYKVISAAKDAIFKLNIEFDYQLNILNKIKKTYKVFATSLEKQAKDFSKIKFTSKYCLVFGSESHGVDLEIKSLADQLIKINISSKIESLNVASSVAIILYTINNNLN